MFGHWIILFSLVVGFVLFLCFRILKSFINDQDIVPYFNDDYDPSYDMSASAETFFVFVIGACLFFLVSVAWPIIYITGIPVGLSFILRSLVRKQKQHRKELESEIRESIIKHESKYHD
jgi:hypothetical protein